MQEGEFVEVAESSIESDSDLSDIKVVEQDRRFTARIMRNLKNHRYRISKNARLGHEEIVDQMIQHYLSKSRRILSQSENHFSDNEISIIETKMDEMKVLKNKMKESQDKTRDVTKTFEKAMPTQNHKPKILKLDEYFDQENDIYLPEVPSEILEPKKADLVYRDEEIERRLTKLKFFNQTWLNDAIKT